MNPTVLSLALFIFCCILPYGLAAQDCACCMSEVQDKVLSCCNESFCRSCIEESITHKADCQKCKNPLSKLKETKPPSRPYPVEQPRRSVPPANNHVSDEDDDEVPLNTRTTMPTNSNLPTTGGYNDAEFQSQLQATLEASLEYNDDYDAEYQSVLQATLEASLLDTTGVHPDIIDFIENGSGHLCDGCKNLSGKEYSCGNHFYCNTCVARMTDDKIGCLECVVDESDS
ncbi:uncharacterized protein LOC126899286 isoform X2 [Daktulosphaira vitifoliae]|uniref:uncharacterized protein LOC126899286 isoform X2 n=1 Tax=Daktulosphaira vitifoliae TaxID=58002 RepID=UPI0021AAFE40|nr:uncharacterized protein LOC126899286 isoform X2 [Daktulosphaira vitifoliae]